jgi:hypothetical protein
MADTTTPATPTIQPITSQDVTPPATSGDNLDSQHGADNFKALSELFDKVEVPAVAPVVTAPTPTPVAPTTDPAAPAAPAAPVDPFEQTLEGIKAGDRTHPNVIKGMDELRRISREEHKARTEAEIKFQEANTKLAEYEAKANTPSIPEDVKKELDELRGFRREVDLKLDPEFQKNYIQPVREAEGNIINILREAGLKDEHVKFIEDHGGIVAMSRSNQVVDEDKGLTAQQWINDELLARTPMFHRNRALGELTNALNTQDKANKELQAFHSQGEERYKAKVEKFTTEFNAGRDEALAELGDIAKPIAVLPTMTAEERLVADNHNARIKQAEAKFAEYIKTSQDPKVSGRIVVKATQADVLAAVNKDLQAQVTSLQEYVNKIKAAGSTSQAGDLTPPPAPTIPSPKDLLRIPDGKALSDLLTGAGVLR